MLHLKKVLGAKPKEHVTVTLAELFTPWGEEIDPAHVLEEHPEPQFARASCQILNGLWECAFVSSGHDPAGDLSLTVKQAQQPDPGLFTSSILVPFSPESPLSGVKRQLQPDELLWYRRSFEAPALEGGQRLLLHFQAVDYACSIWVNGEFAGLHAGGYTPFALDITEFSAPGENMLAVCVADPSEKGPHLRGKQRFDRGDIWYSAQSGIWQTVWLEVVPGERMSSMVIDPDASTGVVSIGVNLVLDDSSDAQGHQAESVKDAHPAAQDDGTPAAPEQLAADEADQALKQGFRLLKLEVIDADGKVVALTEEAVHESTCAVAAKVPDARLWSPEDPYLYSIRLTFGDDVVNSYFGFRTVELKEASNGHKQIYLNGNPLFVKGVLDQAYWSDGLMTAPSDEALLFDIREMRKAGFNLMRKHIKIESARWYYHCDRLGMLVLQDMVSGGDPDIKLWQWSYKPTLFKISWNHYRDDTDKHREELGASNEGYRKEWSDTCCETLRLLGNHPCIIGWSLFNEGWGQFNAKDACAMVRGLDPTRLVDATSGWYDQKCGDFNSVHNYFRDMKVWADRNRKRAFFISEFGGFTHRVEGHSALDKAYGYEPYDDVNLWRAAVKTLLAQMDSMAEKGLAGYIYTQVSDIEEETNGILTYDRRMNKLV